MAIQKNWNVLTSEEKLDDYLIKKYKLSPIVQKILESRKITDESALKSIIEKNVEHDPYLMQDMDKAVKRIHSAVESGEPILVYGDYDADGVTSVSILIEALESIGAICGWYIPNRFTEGYGPNKGAFQQAAEEGVKLIITVDNGIQGHEEVIFANELGMDVIITDHHEIGETLPESYAVIHPAHPEGNYPFEALAGAGVSLKLAQALTGSVSDNAYMLASIGTVSDLVSMTDENRTIVKKGLDLLNQKPNTGISALLKEAQFMGDINEETIGFIIGPRLNAAGRLDDARIAAELLMEHDEDAAEMLAEQVNQYNIERKDIVKNIADAAMQEAEEKIANGSRFLVLAREGWNEGVLGIAASRIVEAYHLPVMVLNIDYENNYAKGSARSIERLSMYDALDHSRELIMKFGGHHMAAGLTLDIENIEALERALNEYMDEVIGDEPIVKTIDIDCILEPADVTVKNIQDMELLRPFGTNFPSPVAALENCIMSDIKQIGQDNRHLKFRLDDINSLMWSEGELYHQFTEGGVVSAAGQLQINEWNNNSSPQIIVSDLKQSALQCIDFRNVHPRRFEFLKDIHAAYIINSDKQKLNEHYFYYGETVEGYDKVIFRDLPKDMADFEKTLAHLKTDIMYFIFHEKHQLYFEGMPDYDKFKLLFKCIMKEQRIDLKKRYAEVTSLVNVSPETLHFMVRVYEDLDFVTFEDGVVQIMPELSKKEITESDVYTQRAQQLQNESRLLFSSFDELKLLIDRLMR